MSVTITWPDNTKEVINSIREATGRPVIVTLIDSVSGCHLCSLDPINNASTNALCSGCDGNYWIPTIADYQVHGHIRWWPFDEPHPMTGGVVYEGDCTATIRYTSQNLSRIQQADYFTVDGKKMVLHKYLLRGKQDINRIRLLLKEEEK